MDSCVVYIVVLPISVALRTASCWFGILMMIVERLCCLHFLHGISFGYSMAEEICRYAFVNSIILDIGIRGRHC